MATNSRSLRRFLFAASLLLGFSAALSPQSAGYFIDTETGEPRFFQRLAWRGGENALRYEVVIERNVNGTYRGHAREFTSALYIDISLPPGRYRFRVIPYDILDRPGEGTGWKNIEILPALKPEIFDTQSEYVSGETSGGSSGYVLNISGRNIASGAEIFVRRAGGAQIIPEVLDSGDGDNIRVFIDNDKLISGEYEIVIRNPGGLEASAAGVKLSIPEPGRKIIPDPLNPMLFNIGLAWIPSIPVYGDYLKGGSSVFGLMVFANALFSMPTDIYIGPELSVLYCQVGFPEGHDPDRLAIIGANLKLLVRKWFVGQRAAMSLWAGASYEPFLDNSGVNVVMGTSLLWRFTDNLLLEGGLDYSHIFSEIPDGLFRPWLGISCQF